MKPFLIIDYSLEHPEVFSPIIVHLGRVGYAIEYRRYYPKLLRSDLDTYYGIGIVMAKEAEIDGYMTTADQKELLIEFINRGKLLIVFTTRPTSLESDREATASNDVSFFNSILNELGINIQINFDQVYDEVNNYAASLVQPPFYRTSKGHPINPKGYEQLTLGRCCSLSVGARARARSGAEADVLLLTYPTARSRSTSEEIPVAAAARGQANNSNNSNNLGYVFLIGKQIFTESGSLSFSRPLLRVDRIKESWNFLKRLAEHIKEKAKGEGRKAKLKTDEEMRRWGDEGKKIEALSPHPLIPSSPHQSLIPPSAFRFLPSVGGYIFGVQKRGAAPASRLKREQSWRNQVDKNIYGWIEAEKIRAGWCYINSGDRSYRKQLIDVCKRAKLNLLWGVADSDMTSGGKIQVTPDVIRQWDEITKAVELIEGGGRRAELKTAEGQGGKGEKTKSFPLLPCSPAPLPLSGLLIRPSPFVGLWESSFLI